MSALLPRRLPGATMRGTPADILLVQILAIRMQVRGGMWLGTEAELLDHANSLMRPTWPGDDPLFHDGPNARRLGNGARRYLAVQLLTAYAEAHPAQALTVVPGFAPDPLAVHIARRWDESTRTLLSIGVAA